MIESWRHVTLLGELQRIKTLAGVGLVAAVVVVVLVALVLREYIHKYKYIHTYRPAGRQTDKMRLCSA